jgi:hypothetical protein
VSKRLEQREDGGENGQEEDDTQCDENAAPEGVNSEWLGREVSDVGQRDSVVSLREADVDTAQEGGSQNPG